MACRLGHRITQPKAHGYRSVQEAAGLLNPELRHLPAQAQTPLGGIYQAADSAGPFCVGLREFRSPGTLRRQSACWKRMPDAARNSGMTAECSARPADA